MRRNSLLAALALAVVAAPNAATAQAAPGWPGYVVKLFRWDEDYAWLKDRPDRDRFPLVLKYQPLDAAGDVYASLGGEYRYRIESYAAPDFGFGFLRDFTSDQTRIQLDADVHVGEAVRAFVQLGYADERGRKPVARPFDEEGVDVAQAFVDVKTGAARWRLGRQEIALGRYVAIRDGTSGRRTFDGVRLDTPFAGWSVTALAARPTRIRDGAFDDDPDAAERLLAAIAERPVPGAAKFRFGLAALERTNANARYAAGLGRERRDTLGARVYGGEGPYDLDAQASWQWGTFRPRVGPALDIRAWGAAMEAGRSFATDLPLRLAVRIDNASGDRRAGDGRLGTFDLPYPNLSYLTDAAIIAPRNVSDIQPFATLQATKTLSLTAGGQWLWRNSTHDMVYSPIGTPVLRSGGAARFVSVEPYLRLDWRLTGLTELQAGWVEALPQAALRQAGGRRDLRFGFVSLAQRF